MARIDVVGDIARVTLALMYPDSQIEENNICFKAGTVGGSDTRASLGAAVYGQWKASFLLTVSPTTVMHGWKVSILNALPPPAPVFAAPGDVGTGSEYNVPTQTRPILSWQTAQAGRAFRGRLFLPTPTIDFVSAPGFPTAAYLAIANAFGSAVLPNVGVSGTTWTPVIAHRRVISVGPPKVISWTSDAIIARIARGEFGTQRKSGNYGRTNTEPW